MKISEAKDYGTNPLILEKLESFGFSEYTEVQELAIKAGLCQGKSLVICSPTSSGKTTIAEIAAINGALDGVKTAYLVTHRALAEEKYLTFKANYDNEDNQWFPIAIATGEHTEGDWNSGILVATYEKYLSILSSSDAYSASQKIIIADEFQIISDSSRGPDVEILLSIFKQQEPEQIITLSATAPNIEELANWLDCECINSVKRDVPLIQKIIFREHCYFNKYGDDEIFEDDNSPFVSNNTSSIVQELLNDELGPILIFTMTKRRAIQLAEQFASTQQQETKSYVVGEQLTLFSEPTITSNILIQISERKVAFHSTDLSFTEREIIERAIKDKKLDVIFATPTLAAGVNFPIKTVVFDSFSRPWINSWISKSEFINMSGRAGRLGIDEEGTAIIIANNEVEFAKAKDYLSPILDPIESKLFTRSVRKSVLHLITSRVCKNETEFNNFYSKTLWWYHHLENNPKILEEVAPRVTESINWLIENKLITRDGENISPTPLGIAISSSGLLPSTGVYLIDLLSKNSTELLSDDTVLPIIHAICSSDEFDFDIGQRNLPYARRNLPEANAVNELQKANLFIDLTNPNLYDRVTNAAYCIYLWTKGSSEQNLRQLVPPITYGQLQTLTSDTAWILEGLSRILSSPGTGFDSQIALKIKMISDSVRLGVPSEAFDIIMAARTHSVPGLGRQRTMALLANDYSDPNSIINADISDIQRVVQSEDRAKALINAITLYFEIPLNRWREHHAQKSKNIDTDDEHIIALYDALGHDYEDKIEIIFQKLNWAYKKIDTRKRQGVPDFILSESSMAVLIECKTKMKSDAVIDKREAFDVLSKGVDINADHYVTIGKPDFDSFSKSKVSGAKNITLVPHHAFIEAYLRYCDGKISAEQIFNWLIIPGYASIDHLPV